MDTNTMPYYGSDDTTIDIADADPDADADEVLAASIEDKMSHSSFTSSECCIFKTPDMLLRQDKRAYVPYAFSIGPLHHGKRHLKKTEKIKLQYLNGLIARAPTSETSLHNFIKAIRNLVGEARECYAAPFYFSVDKFVEILVVDGCFIIELLRKIDGEAPSDVDDPSEVLCMWQFLSHDLVLLENQIPWVVLDCLFNMTTVPPSKSLPELAIEFLSHELSKNEFSTPGTEHGSKHMLDLLRNSMVLSSGLVRKYRGKWRLIPNATSLIEAGIKFKKGTSHSLLDIKFCNGVLEIPPLLLFEKTNFTLRNLISFEQCRYAGTADAGTAEITCYVVLINNLISNTKDVNILVEHGVLETWLNPGETVELLKGLYRDTVIDSFYYLELCDQVNEYCQRKWPKWRALYVRNHFSSPWAIVSQVVAGILLILSFLQTFYAIKK